MISPLSEIRRGEPITADFLNAIVRQLRAIAPQASADILPSCQPGGTTFKLRRLSRSNTVAPSDDVYPFEILNAPPADPNNPSVSDWRRFVVQAATIQNHTINNDNASASPLIVSPPAGTANYFVWYDATLDTNGIVTAVTLAAGTAGSPAQPQGDNSTGDPPSHFYHNVAEISVGSDNPNDATYHQVSIAPILKNSQWLDVVGYQLQCDAVNGFVLLKRMSARAV
jgi:hypothetical protein